MKIYFEMEDIAISLVGGRELVDETLLLEQRWSSFPVGRSMINGLSPPCWSSPRVLMLYSPAWTEAERAFWRNYRVAGTEEMQLEVSDDFFENLRLS